MLKEHQGLVIEKCCKLLGTTTERVLGPPRKDKLSASRLSLAIFKSYKSSGQSFATGVLASERVAINLMQTTQWIYERGMQELQDIAVEYFHDIPVQIKNWDWSDKWSYPVINCQATYLTFDIPTSDKGSLRPVREAPSLITYEKCVVMPYHESSAWKRLRPMDIPESVSYKARRAQDGEMDVGTGRGNLNTRTQLSGCKIWRKRKLVKVIPPTNVLSGQQGPCPSRHSTPNLNRLRKVAWC